MVNKLDKNKETKKKPLKLSSSGRLQIRKNLGPEKTLRNKQDGKGKTIQVIFKNKSNQRQKSSTAKLNPRSSSMYRPKFS